MDTENPFSKDDPMVYPCAGSPEACSDCAESHSCNFALEFRLIGKPAWMLVLFMELLKDNRRAEAHCILDQYLSYVGARNLEVQFKGVLDGLPQTADLWKSLSTIFQINDMEKEAQLSLQKGLEIHPRSLDLLYMFTRGDRC